ncbi:MAG: MraY family glycosyltransferase [Anaerolineae bacterium]|nr:undecaprenyl/decaprenyl-phosphate alpha-N-acetylglucosaminyl 1-phosphate transferase [Anaerolineae bacterium]MDW8300265.1 MraY family glycosyltransferase [Anaerolineae bacterium]
MLTAYWLSVGLTFGLSLVLSVLLTQIARRLSPALGILAKPDSRRRHHGAIPKLGALPLWFAFMIAVLTAQSLPVERADPNEAIRLLGLVVGGTLIFLFGLLDDKFDLPPHWQLLGQVAAAGVAIACLIFIERFNNPLTGETVGPLPFALTFVISMFWLLLMMNTVNFLDGVDGLAGGVNLIAAVLLFLHTLRENQLSVSLLPAALVGTLLGFLAFNWHPAKIFMGSGAVYLGFVIGALSIIGGAKMATILLVMGLPLLDLAWQAGRRLLEGKNPMIGDRGHLHFRVLDAGLLTPRAFTLIYYAFCATFGALALLTTSRQFKLIALLVMISIACIGFMLVARYSRLKAPISEQIGQ